LTKFAHIIIPKKLNELFTYTIPENQSFSISVGKRVLIEFGNRIVTGIIAEISDKSNLVKIKPIIKVLDEKPIVSKEMFRFLKWIADYYLCTLGEVITAALPSFLLREQKLKLKANLIPDNFPALEKIKINSKNRKFMNLQKTLIIT
jgi:primosomal protein N' (replication factor Y) (superfamily II helicase)